MTPVFSAHARAGFPARPEAPVAAAAMPPCRIYYPHYHDLNMAQKAFYIYWRQQYEAGTALPADATYRFLYVYELATHAKSAEDLEAAWIALRREYRKNDAFTQNLSTWIVDLRLMQSKPVYDAITESLADAQLVLDLAIAAKTAPHARALIPLYSKRLTAIAGVDALRHYEALASEVDTHPVVAASVGVTATAIQRQLFANVGDARVYLARFGALNKLVFSYKRSTAVQTAIDTIVEAMLHLIGQATPRDRKQPASEREAIVHAALAGLPAADSLAGIAWSAHAVWEPDALLVLLLVLWLSDVKPYVEGRIAFSAELRGHYGTIGDRLGLYATVGTMRKAYWSLSHGSRAVWRLDPPVTDASQIKTSVSGARFTRALQHLFVGSVARAEAMNEIVAQLARRTRTSRAHVIDLLTETTGTAPTTRI
ncbi:MAG TPA: TerB N-terminal domain-containing protein [Candidatus Baltobacteraceae bacterium]|jgi:hypothetical protein